MQDTSSFREFYELYAGMVYNLCLNYLQNPEEAEEATQDVFVKAHKKWDTFRQEAQRKTWLYRISINQCLDMLKARKRQKRFGIHTELEGVSAAEINHPGIQLEDKEALEALLRQINTLPDKQKTAIILKHIEGMSMKEIGEVLKISPKAVESLLSRAKAALKKKRN